MSTTATRPARGLGWLYAVGGALGLAAAVALTLEKIATLTDPDYVPTCSLNPTISCGSVMDSDQAAAFGFPNPLIGIAAFAVVTTVGVVRLAGFAPPRWFRVGMQAGATFGVVFVHWLIAASLYDIHALCPYCMLVWAVTIPIFWYTTLDTLRAFDATRDIGDLLARAHSAVLAAWYVAIAVLVLVEFWDYWRTLF
ncbi:vitamin K epoxide reductase family protein [Actinophytocola gossypii]|uniref:Vitamin K epoxide reductase family protein n=1 Tax=Actinophytocola gossypii TaxID=2812003 RepID=A0ABT2J475_9PSEU|nr:vitamin K epoxide reductase family protein [Actinophytocola gossypii]MCT2582099.1 vitamin K epoxide reductase family protein [Actinophytocola gossypii]